MSEKIDDNPEVVHRKNGCCNSVQKLKIPMTFQPIFVANNYTQGRKAVRRFPVATRGNAENHMGPQNGFFKMA